MGTDWPLLQYRLRREGGLIRRRYVVMGVSPEGTLEWEWEPISTREVFKRLTAAGHHVTDIWPLLNAADEEAERRR